MLIQTKILCEVDEATWWDDFMFDLTRYVSHSRFDEDYSSLLLTGMVAPIMIQISFDDLVEHLEILNTFETISLN